MGKGVIVEMSAYEKGVELEKLVYHLFLSKGYDVKHNVKLKGRSGVEHQVDVYAEYSAPLHVSRIIIECKAYDKPIDKDVVMKLIQVVQDVGADRGILVTTSYFTPDAESTAKGYPIDLWDYIKLREILSEIQEFREIPLIHENVFYIKPLMALEEARGKIKETILGEKIVYYPYYEVSGQLLIMLTEGFLRKKEREQLRDVKVLIDAYIGAIVDNSRSGISPIMPLLTNLQLSRDELEALKTLAKVGSLSVPALASQLSWSEAKARKAIQGLVARGLVKTTKVERTTYYSFIKPKLEELTPLSTQVTLLKGEPKDGVLIKPTISQTDIENSLESLWDLKINEQKLIYYPYYISKISRKGVEEIRAIDLVKKALEEKMQRVFSQMVFSGTISL
ncbi:MAG: restriction endonuclease [Desulfurococcaceae archaeon]